MNRTNLDKLIGQTVELIMEKRGLARKNKPFAKSIGLDDAYFRRLRKGTARWNTGHLEMVAKGLNINVVELFGRKKDSQNPLPQHVIMQKIQMLLESGNQEAIKVVEKQIDLCAQLLGIKKTYRD